MYIRRTKQSTEDDDDVVWEIQVFEFCLIIQREKNSGNKSINEILNMKVLYNEIAVFILRVRQVREHECVFHIRKTSQSV